MRSDIRVVICDDDPTTRALVRAILDDVGVEIVGEASDGAACLVAIAAGDPDVLVLDLHMPGADGFHVLDALRERGLPRPRVLVFSSAREEHVQDRVRALGADFVAKGTSPDDLAAAVRKLAA